MANESCGTPPKNRKELENQVKNLGNDKINHKVRHCDCDGNPIP